MNPIVFISCMSVVRKNTILCSCTCPSLYTTILNFPLFICICTVKRRAIVTILGTHRQDMDVVPLISDLQSMGIVTTEQCQKLAYLCDVKQLPEAHEALLYILLAHDGSNIYHKLVECMGRRYPSIAKELQGVLIHGMCS